MFEFWILHFYASFFELKYDRLLFVIYAVLIVVSREICAALLLDLLLHLCKHLLHLPQLLVLLRQHLVLLISRFASLSLTALN